MAGVKSFIHLKPVGAGNGDAGAAGNVEMRKAAAEVAKTINSDNPAQLGDSSFHDKSKDASKTPQKSSVTMSSLIMDSRHCYGCEKFAVDAPGTQDEVGWCQRDLDDEDEYKYEFRMIPTHATVRQCPRVRSGEWKVVA